MATPSKSKPTRWIPYILGAGLVVLIVIGLRPQPVTVETARVVTGPLRATVSEEGKTRIKQRYVVAAPVSGQLRRIAFKPGAEVEAGVTIVAVIDPLPASPLDERNRALAEARRDSTAAVLERSRTSQELARKELGRIEQMFNAGTISPQELESAKMRENIAARDVASAEGALKQVEAELAVTGTAGASASAPVEVRANATGRVLHVFQESARAVMQGTPLLEIGDPSDLEVIVEMLSRDGAAIAAGAPVALEQWGGPAALEGRVRLVEPAAFTKYSALGVEEQRVNVVVDITSPRETWRSLGDNFRVEARVITWESDRALKVPVSGIFRSGRDWAAFVVRGGAAKLVPVQAGKSSGAEIQVTEGLQEGDEVILYPGDRIKDGQRVKPAKV
ncbi:Putative efflux system component YknX [Lacunisphaera limnophila]|uniref:Efflux system component YknX n=1 Tax=Lacunisphaera limnophila TaxID=1838286 RepID=A0A1D8AR53_9BACT|nr:efflux RND transporter periplasmic adaptor subunit [Lacunisphaera limnophila]AOS43364.1 Putative efflux system component YknX [Lacunisphaera limnophila]